MSDLDLELAEEKAASDQNYIAELEDIILSLMDNDGPSQLNTREKTLVNYIGRVRDEAHTATLSPSRVSGCS